MKYKITEQENYALIEIIESRLNENHHTNLRELLTDIKSKKNKSCYPKYEIYYLFQYH